MSTHPRNTSRQENLKSLNFDNFLFRPKVTDIYVNNSIWLLIAILTPHKVSCVYVLSLVRKWEIYVSDCGRRISRPEVNFKNFFHVTLEIISFYNIYEFEVDHMKNKRDFGHRKSRNWKVFGRLPEVDASISGRLNIFLIYRIDLINW